MRGCGCAYFLGAFRGGVVMVNWWALFAGGWRWLVWERCLWGRGDDWLASAVPRGVVLFGFVFTLLLHIVNDHSLISPKPKWRREDKFNLQTMPPTLTSLLRA